VAAATIDQSATATLVRSDRIYRQALAQTASRLQELDALKPGLPLDRATDILWFFGHQALHLLVSQLQWSWDDAEQWLAEQASTALLDPGR
jgi:hypothetical protein